MADGEDALQEQPAQPALPTPPPLPTITTAADWAGAARRRWLLTLPSGATVKARALDVASMLFDGSIDAAEFQEMNTPTVDRDVLKKRADFARRLACFIVTEPTVASGPQENGTMSSDLIPAHDALALFGWAIGGTATMLRGAVPVEPE